MTSFDLLKRMGLANLFLIIAVNALAQDFAGPGWQIVGAAPNASSDVVALADLAPSANAMTYAGPIATAITPELRALAAGLNNDPVRIFNFVHNRIEYQPYYGSNKGAHLTYIDGAGNDMDQASLLISLLNQAGYTSTSYVYGKFSMPEVSNGQDLANWFGGISQAVLSQMIGYTGIPTSASTNGRRTIDRVWVRATINGTVYDLDPSYKVHQISPTIDLGTLKSMSGYDRTQLLTDAGGTATSDYIQNASRPNVENRLGQCAISLRNAIKASIPNVEMESVVGGGHIIEQPITALVQGAPVAAFSPAVVTTFSSLSAQYIATFRVQIDSDIDVTFNADSLQGTRLSLTFSGNNAQLWLGDTLVAQQSAGSGATANIILTITHPGQQPMKQVLPTSYNRSSTYNYDLTYSFFPNPRSSGCINAGNRQLQNYLAMGKTDSSREVLTESLHVLGLKWVRQVALTTALAGRLQSAFSFVDHIVGRTGQEAGYYVDMPGVYGTFFDSSGIAYKTFKLSAFVASAMEHGDIDQSTGTTALSTIKCLALACDGGQKIFKATSANYGSIVSGQLTGYDSGSLSSFSNKIGSGDTLLLHQNGQTGINERKGAGYADFSGSGVGMIISGDYHGGYASTKGTLSGAATTVTYQNQSTQWSAPPSIAPVRSAEPVDLLTGAYTMEHTDLTLGAQGSPRGLSFTRYYDSSRNFISSDLGKGWSHSYEGKVTLSSELDNAFGFTQPTDAAQTIVGFIVAGDFLDTTLSPKELLVGALAANWTVNRIKDNAANVQLGNQRMTYISQPDGSWNPPPGSTTDLTGAKGSFTLYPRFGGSISFDTRDRISQWKDVDGNTQTYKYDDSGSGFYVPTFPPNPPIWVSTPPTRQLLKVTDSYGRTLTFSHVSPYGASPISSVTDSTGRSVKFDRTSAGSTTDLVQITDPENYNTTLVYDSRHRLTDWKDHAGATVTHNDYDDFDRVYQQLSQGLAAHTWKFLYSPGATLEVNPQNGITAHLFDYKNRNAGTIDALGHASAQSYDGQNHVVKTVDATGKQTINVYDGNQNLTQSTDNNNKSTLYQYDSSLRLWKATDATNKTTTYLYYDNHKLKSVTEPGIAQRKTQYFYRAADGLVDYVLDSANNKTSYTGYDSYGNPTNITRCDNTTTSATYNARGDLLTSTDGRSKTTTYTYDKRRLLKTRTDALNKVTIWEYDSNGNLFTVTDRNNHTVTSIHDNLGHVQSVTSPDTVAINYTYDTCDWLWKVTDGLNHTNTYDYFANGRRKSLTNALNIVTAQWDYDEAGRMKEQKDGLLHATQFFYNTAGRLDYSRDPLNHDTDHTYDDAGRPQTITNKRGKTFTFGHGDDGLPTTFTYPTSTAQRPRISQIIDRDAHGLPKTLQSPSGAQAVLTYDGMSRLWKRTDAEGAIEWKYDEEGNPEDVVETTASGATTIHREFDDLGRVQSCTDPLNYTVGYTYDDEGNVKTIAYPGNKIVTYTYDGSNRLKSVTDWSNRTTTYNYDTAGRLDTVERPNSTRHRVILDAANRLQDSYDEKVRNGRVTNTFYHTSYQYYDDNRLKNVTQSRLAKTLTAPSSSVLTYDDDNQIDTYNGVTVVRDLDGNLGTAPVNGTQLGALSWDKRNRLLGAGGTTYTYDAENRRMTSTTNGQTTKYIWSRGAKLDRLLAKINPDLSVTRYIYGTGLLYEETTDAGGNVVSTLFYFFDWRGDTVALSDGDGAIVARMSYSPYGERTIQTGTVNTPFCFNGQWGVMTETSGLLCMQARFYSPVFCRFLNEDPAGLAGGINLYAFAAGDPIDLMDPFGLGPVNSGSGIWGRLGNGLAGAASGAMTGATSGAVVGAGVGALAGGVGAGPGAIAGAGGGAIAGGISGFIRGVMADPNTSALSVANSAGIDGYAAGALGGMGAAASAARTSTSVSVTQASTWDTSITAAGSRVTNVATNVSAQQFESNLASNGFNVVKQTMGANGPVTVLSNGQTTYTIYTATSTGAASAQVTNAAGQVLTKIRLGP